MNKIRCGSIFFLLFIGGYLTCANDKYQRTVLFDKLSFPFKYDQLKKQHNRQVTSVINTSLLFKNKETDTDQCECAEPDDTTAPEEPTFATTTSSPSIQTLPVIAEPYPVQIEVPGVTISPPSPSSISVMPVIAEPGETSIFAAIPPLSIGISGVLPEISQSIPSPTSTEVTPQRTLTSVLTPLVAVIATALAVVSIRLSLIEEPNQIDPPSSLPTGFFFAGAPVNALEIPVTVQGGNLPTDGCPINAALFGDIGRQLQENGTCYPLLTRGPCVDPRFWVTLDPNTKMGRCTPRLCGRSRVFVERDGLCHDIYDPTVCGGGRRLFYSPFGDPICDCPLGQFPFPTPQDNCVTLFQQGSCPQGSVVNFAEDGRLECAPSQCPSSPPNSNPLVPVEDDRFCYEWGTTGPCNPTTELLGYDVFQIRTTCVGLTDPLSPYFSSLEEDEMLDNVFNQLSAEFDDFRIILVQQNPTERKSTAKRRQGQNTYGSFQVSSSLPDVLLNPCRPGVQNGSNTKCTSPILPEKSEKKRRDVKQAVRSAFKCPDQRILKATGQCRKSNSFF